jgi:hypothetical protein
MLTHIKHGAVIRDRRRFIGDAVDTQANPTGIDAFEESVISMDIDNVLTRCGDQIGAAERHPSLSGVRTTGKRWVFTDDSLVIRCCQVTKEIAFRTHQAVVVEGMDVSKVTALDGTSDERRNSK